MPELPEVETVRRGLQSVMEGARFIRVEARRPDLRFPLPERFVERLTGRTIIAIGRRAKYLIFHIKGGPVLICHLGMTGSFRIEGSAKEQAPGDFCYQRSKNAAHDHVTFELSTVDGAIVRVVFNDPRRFGFMLFSETLADAHPMLANLGVEPTGNSLDGPLLASLFKDRKAPLKAALLDQKLIAGLGNIYVSEALWRAGLSPLREAQTIAGRTVKAKARADSLAQAVRSVIADAIAAGGSSMRDYVHTDGSLGYFQHTFAVYGREGEACRTASCNGHIERIVQSGRSTFYCRACQK